VKLEGMKTISLLKVAGGAVVDPVDMAKVEPFKVVKVVQLVLLMSRTRTLNES
jgi:hypothetical protein